MRCCGSFRWAGLGFHRIFFQLDDPHGGRRIEDHGELLAELEGLAPVCP